LKPGDKYREHTPVHVAPRAGAWIETNKDKNHWFDDTVAPRAGAWIET